MGLFTKKFTPPYASGYELGLYGTKKEIEFHIDEAYSMGGYEGDCYEKRVQDWHSDSREGVKRGALAALKEGRPQNLAILIHHGGSVLKDFTEMLEDMTPEEIKSMSLSDDDLFNLLRNALYGFNKKVVATILESGFDVHYHHERALCSAVRIGKDDMVAFLHDHGANIEDAFLGADRQGYGSTDVNAVKAGLRAFQIKTTGKTTLSTEDKILAELIDEKKILLEKIEQLTTALETEKAKNAGKGPTAPKIN